MYLSQLLIDTGGNPDRPRPGRMWMGNAYHVHQRLCMAFDEKPDNKALFLFRVDNHISDDASRAMVIVQSEREPDWDYAFHNAPDFLAAPPETRVYNPVFQQGETLRYRLLANPTKKITSGDFARFHETKLDNQGRRRTLGKRVSIAYTEKLEGKSPEERTQLLFSLHGEWLAKKGCAGGFALCSFELIRLFRVAGKKPHEKATCKNGSWNLHKDTLTFNAALMEGVLEVTDADAFAQTLRTGIGTAKSFGFGLLSVVRR